jgi:hypothetical protein
MSLGRIGARAAFAAIGVLVSLAVMAAPSWAAKGNSANAKLCEAGGYPGVLLAQDGSAFKNEGKCTSYAAKGGQLAGVNGVAEGVTEPFPGFRVWTATFSGFGLKPGSEAFGGFRYEPSGVSDGRIVTVNSEGTFSATAEQPCEIEPFGTATGNMAMEATTAAGTVFVREFVRPSGC